MKRPSGEARVLAALYLVFALFLGSFGPSPASWPAEVTGEALARPEEETLPPLSVVAEVLTRRGFVPAGRVTPFFPRPLPCLVTAWQTEKPVIRPVAFLRETGGELEAALAGAGIKPVREVLAVAGATFRLDLELVLPEGGLLVSLAATEKEERPSSLTRPVFAPRPSSPRPRRLPRPSPRPPVPPTPPRIKARVAIVLDDAGEVPGLEDFLALPIPLTVAVMPKRRYSEAHARLARAAGREVILHLPLEAQNGQDPGPGTIRRDWPPERIRQELEEDLASVPGAVGVNNHMGSAGTADETLMRTVLGVLKEKGLFFLDSRTGAASVVPRVAGELGLPYLENGKFLDPAGASPERIRELIRELLALAKKKGKAVGICHANRPHTLAALRAALPELSAAGIEVVPLGELLK